jgi:hypothetical protein
MIIILCNTHLRVGVGGRYGGDVNAVGGVGTGGTSREGEQNRSEDEGRTNHFHWRMTQISYLEVPKESRSVNERECGLCVPCRRNKK